MFKVNQTEFLKSFFKLESRSITPSELFIHKIILSAAVTALLVWDLLGLLNVPGFKFGLNDLAVWVITFASFIFSFRRKPFSTLELEAFKLLPAISIYINTFWTSFSSTIGLAEIVTNLIVIIVPMGFLRTLPGLTFFCLNALAVIPLFAFVPNLGENAVFVFISSLTVLILGYISNFTRIKKTEDFERNYKFLDRLVSNMSEGLVIHDSSGRITKINEAACQILEITEDQALGKSNYDPLWVTKDTQGETIPPDNHPSSKTLAAGARVLNFPIEYQNHLNKITKSLLVSSIPIFESNDSKPDYALVTIVDKTQQKKTDDELRTNQAMLAHASKLTSLGEMAAGIAHEINNPLAVIIARAAIVKKKSTGAEPLTADFIQQNISTIESTCLRISKIITNMRNFARNDGVVEFQDIRLKEVLDDTVMLIKEGLKKAQIDLDLSEFNDFPIYGNSVQLGQVFMNLMQNSRDAVKTQEVKWIKVSSHSAENFVEIRVKDSGPKISDEVAQKIMQPFFTTKEVGQGTGLGLSISQSIIKKHKGELLLNRESENTEFVIRLPSISESVPTASTAGTA